MWHPMRNLALSGILVFQVVARVAGECGTINSTGYAGGTTAGVACAFPFTHLGKSYTDCTHAGSDRGAWCGIAGWGTGNAIEWGLYVSPSQSTTMQTPSSTRSSLRMPSCLVSSVSPFSISSRRLALSHRGVACCVFVVGTEVRVGQTPQTKPSPSARSPNPTLI
jgi:hypothetical protein